MDMAAYRRPSSFAHDATIRYVSAKGRGGLACWLAVPRTVDPEAPPLVAVHGIRRDVREQAESFAAAAARFGRPVIAPLFEAQRWPRYQLVVRQGRADLALLELLRELRLAGLWSSRTFDLFGYSGGAQFAHRFTMLYPHLVGRLTAASAGWYTFPDDSPFPYGLRGRAKENGGWGPRMAASLDRFLHLPIHVCVGDRDNVPDANTRGGAEIDAQQGTHRLERAERWAEALRETARARGITFRVSFSILPDSGHDFVDCVRRGGLDRLVVPAAEPEHSGPLVPDSNEASPITAA